jgi:hypothetical protein
MPAAEAVRIAPSSLGAFCFSLEGLKLTDKEQHKVPQELYTSGSATRLHCRKPATATTRPLS